MARKSRRQHGEGSIFQRKDGRWVCKITRPPKHGKPQAPKYLYGATPDEVIDKRDRYLRDLDAGHEPSAGRAPRMGWWLWHWVENISAVRDSTKVRYRSRIRCYLEPHLGAIRCDELTEPAIEEMIAAMRRAGIKGQPLADTTLLATLAVLNLACKAAVARRGETHMRRNPCDQIELGPIERAEILPPTNDEGGAILAEADRRPDGARWSVGMALGTRQGEALGMLWPMIDLDDLDNASLTIHWELVRLPWRHGCDDPRKCGERHHRRPCPPDCPKAARTSGRRHVCIPTNDKRLCRPDCDRHAKACQQRRGGGLKLTPPKSRRSKRTAHIPRPLAERLKRYRAWQAQQRLKVGPDWEGWQHDCDRRARPREVVCPRCGKPMDPNALVWTQPNGRPRDPRRDWQEWTDLLEGIGAPHYRLHDGRHFAATLLLALGVDVRVVSEILGHSSTSFTRDTYQHVAMEMQKQAMGRAADALWAGER